MDQQLLTIQADLLLNLIPSDGSTVGNQALREQFLQALLGLGHTAHEALFDELREMMVRQGLLEKGKGRGGSVRRLAVQSGFELAVGLMPAPKAAPTPRPKTARTVQPAAPASDAQIISYRHRDRRKNNPEVGVVTPATDPDSPKTVWSFDPHLDPALQFDSGRSSIEALIDDALASGDEAEMRAALEELKRLQSPYLNWTGKAERTSFVVDTVSLHVHERMDPMSILAAVRKGQIPPGPPFSKGGVDDMDGNPTLKKGGASRASGGIYSRLVQPGLFEAPFESLPLRDAIDFYKHDRGWANRLVAGDSLLVMNSLLQKEGMAGQVQMIYLDPPYGIKYGSNFQPFVGKRDVKDRSDADLTQEPEMIKAFRDTWELGIHSYLTYLRDRLLLAKDLLSESGSVFVQISDENLHLVRNLMDEIFGCTNFCTLITIAKTAGSSTDQMSSISDYLLWFGKDKSKVMFNLLFNEKLDGEGADEYKYLLLPEGQSRTMSKRELKGIESVPVGAQRYRPSAMTSQRPMQGNDLREFNLNGKLFSPGLGTFKTDEKGLERLAKSKRLVPRDKSISYLRKLDDFPVMPINNLWTDVRWGFDASDKRYVVETNQKVIERCLLMTTDPGDLVLDPTCGSGTTAYVAEKWGRRWITCDTSRVAVTLAKQRLVTASYDYFALKYPHEGLKGGFIYKTVPHVTLKSIANNPDIDEIYERMHPAVEKALGELNAALTPPSQPPPAGGRSESPLTQQVGESPLPQRERAREGEFLQEWTVPFDFPPDWLESAQAPFDAFHKSRQAMQKQMDASIAAHADQETLFDQPQPDKKKLRITGPFTVEAVPFPTVLALDEAQPAHEADVAIARSGESARQHQWRDELLTTGIRGKGGQMLRFADLETLPAAENFRHLHASGHLDSGERVVISFGPQHGALEQRQVELALREAGELFPLPKMIVYCAFAFDPEAAKDIDQLKGITALKAQMNTDLLTEDLKKARSSNQSFWLMGQPDVEVRQVPNPTLAKGGASEASGGIWYQVEVNGFDYFDTSKGELVSGGKGKIAMWLLDTDYDERSLFPRQVFFPLAGKGEGWQKLKKNIRAELNEDLLEQFHGTVSLPFEAGDNRKVAVKIVDDRGIESLKIILLED